MKLIGAVFVASVVGCAAGQHQPPDRAQARTPACNLRGLSVSEREESARLLQKLSGAVAGIEELADGYSVRLDTAKLSPGELLRWVDLERRCCPFFHFGLELEPEATSATLRLTGGEGVKEFIKTKFGA